jgi:hypothetical protein
MSHLRTILIVMGLVVGGLCAGQYPGLVTLQGRQFMVDGQPFYPRVMNYGVHIVSNTMNSSNPDDLMISPASEYDRSIYSYYEYNNQEELDDQFRTHFAKLVSMGFNAIRIYALGPIMRRTSPEGSRHYSIDVRHRVDTYTTEPSYRLDLDIPTFSDQLSQRYFELVRHVVRIADQSGLKVILLCADDLGNTDVSVQLTPASDIDAVDLYTAYLKRLSEELMLEPGILAYDLWNEPIWTNYDLIALSKQDVCTYTGQWYDAIRYENGDKHLITLGGYSIPEIGSWDPAVMKLDFYSPHIYPELLEINGYSFENAMERYRNEVYWLARTCPMPYLIGETGFSAEDDDIDPLDHTTGANNQHLNNDAMTKQMPYMMGSELEQATFATESMDIVSNYLGSGYSWWAFQNSRAANLLSPAKDYLGCWWAPLKFGNDAGLPLPAPWNVENAWRDKAMVAALVDYPTPSIPDDLSEPPANYYNGLEIAGPPFRHYQVLEQSSNRQIIDAVLQIGWKFQSTESPSAEPITIWLSYFSDDNGFFTIRKPPSIFYFTPPIAHQIKLSASGGSEIYTDNLWTDGSIITIEQNLFKFENYIVNYELIWENGNSLNAWSKLFLVNSVIYGSGSPTNNVIATAREEVNLTGETHIGGGSESHLFCSNTFMECNETTFDLPLIVSHQLNNKSLFNTINTLGLSFNDNTISISPNPSSSFILVKNTLEGSMLVYNVLGEIVYEDFNISRIHSIDISNWPTGSYYVVVQSGKKITSGKLKKL